ncbi:MAG: hypothetical protein I3I98_08635 [Mobilibacterium timonense]|uniref:hypothetical protein n=1 Tax=Mobilibacterium timonense TaxID=1871012 RepID=UPI002354DDA1|nr:hypothetical protein [Mobilibacterium timonense]MBM6991438.1 hypothetical protein [Mobilibacterium timonense]
MMQNEKMTKEDRTDEQLQEEKIEDGFMLPEDPEAREKVIRILNDPEAMKKIAAALKDQQKEYELEFILSRTGLAAISSKRLEDRKRRIQLAQEAEAEIGEDFQLGDLFADSDYDAEEAAMTREDREEADRLARSFMSLMGRVPEGDEAPEKAAEPAEPAEAAETPEESVETTEESHEPVEPAEETAEPIEEPVTIGSQELAEPAEESADVVKSAVGAEEPVETPEDGTVSAEAIEVREAEAEEAEEIPEAEEEAESEIDSEAERLEKAESAAEASAEEAFSEAEEGAQKKVSRLHRVKHKIIHLHKKNLVLMIIIEVGVVALLGLAIYQAVLAKEHSDWLAADGKKTAVALVSPEATSIDSAYNLLTVSVDSEIDKARVENLRKKAAAMEFIPEERSTDIENSETYQIVKSAYYYNGPHISSSRGTVTGPNGRETYYNLNMSGVVSIMHSAGYSGTYWVRSDGVKMFGNYVMVAANLSLHPKGSIVRSSVGLAMVVDTGGFASSNPQQLDIATTW